MRNKLIGGVSPLKRRTSRTKAGTVGASKKGTHTKAQDKSGYSRSGAEGVNTHSFTPNTRVTSSLVEAIDIPKAAAAGKDGKSGKTIIGTDASGAPIYNEYNYGDTTIDQSATYTDSFNQTANVNQEAGGGTTTKKKKKSHGNFREACYETDGSRKPSGSIGVDSNGNRFKCVWGGRSSSSSSSSSNSSGNGNTKIKQKLYLEIIT